MNYNLTFSTKFRYYRARFWDNCGYDTYAKVPEKFWQELGHTPPTMPSDRMEKLALKWAAAEAVRREKRLTDDARESSRKKNLRETWALYQAENPEGVGAETLKRDGISFAAVANHVDVDRLLPGEVDKSDLVGYINARKEDTVRRTVDGEVEDVPVRNRTINNEVGFVERLVAFAKDFSKKTGCTATRLTTVKRLPEQDSLQVALTEEQVGELLRHADAIAPAWKIDVMIVGIATRLRRENLLELRAEWIDWRERWLRIPAEFMKKGRAEIARELSIPIPEIALERLGSPRLRGYIWTNPETSLPYTKIVGLVEWAAAAGTPEFSMHDWRTTGNTWLKIHGVDHLTRKAMMGHSVRTGDVTDLYTKVIDEEKRKAAAIVDEIFRRILRPEMKLLSFGANKTSA